MSNKLRHIFALCAAVLVGLTGAVCATLLHTETEAETLEAAETAESAPYEPLLTLPQTGRVHSAYISGYADGAFHPDDTLSLAEGAQLLFNLLDAVPEERAEFPDVDAADWYYDALGVLGAYGILDADHGRIRPDAPLTRARFAAMAARFFPDKEEPLDVSPFSDVTGGNPYYDEILRAVDYGFLSGYADGTFRPNDTLTRAEAVTILNRMTGRADENDYTDSIVLPLFSDLDSSHWAYTAVMEAALSHVCAESDAAAEAWTWTDTEALRRTPGLYFVGLDYYYISAETGLPVTDTTVGGLYFGADGRYTSGDAEIDGYVMAVLEDILTDDMTQEERLRAAYLYTRDNFTYLKRHYYQPGDTGWELEEARTMFSTGLGNCYCFASVFYYLSRQIGYDSKIISGTVGSNASPHGWVEIAFDGTDYIFDTELDMAKRLKGLYYDFFYMMPPYTQQGWSYRK